MTLFPFSRISLIVDYKNFYPPKVHRDLYVLIIETY